MPIVFCKLCRFATMPLGPRAEFGVRSESCVGPMGRVALLCSALLCSGSLDWALCLGAGWLEASRGKAGLAGKITWYLVMAKSWGVARGDLREFHFGEVKRHDFSPFVGLDS